MHMKAYVSVLVYQSEKFMHVCMYVHTHDDSLFAAAQLYFLQINKTLKGQYLMQTFFLQEIFRLKDEGL